MNKLRKVREAAGLTQAVLAKRAKTSQDHVSDIERGKHLAGQKLLGRLAKTLKCKVAELL